MFLDAFAPSWAEKLATRREGEGEEGKAREKKKKRPGGVIMWISRQNLEDPWSKSPDCCGVSSGPTFFDANFGEYL